MAVLAVKVASIILDADRTSPLCVTERVEEGACLLLLRAEELIERQDLLHYKELDDPMGELSNS